jgi:EAL domain-containing protein (putative c-di-GMP-specific phosphodiesterase class I)
MFSSDLKAHRIPFYAPDNPKLIRLSSDLAWIQVIESAIFNNRCALYLQNVVSLTEPDSRRYYEVSVRLFDPKGRMIPPSVFLPVAERYSLLPDLDRGLIQNLFASLVKIDPNLIKNSCFAINLSKHSLNKIDFVSTIHEKLNQLEISPEFICFEITETVALSNLEIASDLITYLQSLGYYFTLDDFGRGLSSLSYLKHLPVDYIKIPGIFIRNMLSDPTDRSIVEMIHYLGQKMGLKTIAEDVETEVIFQQVKAIGIDYAQGYYLSKPQPFEQVL